MGNILARYQRIVHYPSPGGHHFNRVHYVPVEKKEIQTEAMAVLSKVGEIAHYPESVTP
jgi:hypothetical protein